MPVPRPGLPWRRIALVISVLLVAAALGWVGYFYHTHVLPNVSVAGAAVGNTSRAEVERAVARQAAELRLRLTSDDASRAPTLAEVGVRIDEAATVEAVFDARRLQDMPEALALWQTSNVPLRIEVDEQVLGQYLAANFSEVYEAPVQPELVYGAGQFELVPGEAGTGFDVAAIANDIEDRAADPGTITIRASERAVLPSVTDVVAANTQEEANKRLWVKLDFLYQNKLIYFPEASEMAQWYIFEVSRDGTELVIRYDRAAMATFIETRVNDSLNSFFGPGGSEGEGGEYLQIIGVDALVEDMIDAMQAKESLEKEVEAVTVSAGRQETSL